MRFNVFITEFEEVFVHWDYYDKKMFKVNENGDKTMRHCADINFFQPSPNNYLLKNYNISPVLKMPKKTFLRISKTESVLSNYLLSFLN